MKRMLLPLLALLPLAALARPLLIPPRHLQLPLPAEPEYPGQYAHNFYDVAIDGDLLLVSGRRTVDTSENGVNGVYVFRRAASGNWNYSGPLIEGLPFLHIDVEVGGNIATVLQGYGVEVYEFGASGWARTATFADPGFPLRIENGSIFMVPNRPPNSPCAPPYTQYRKVNGTWQVVATIGEARCEYEYPEINDGRALSVSTAFINGQRPPVPLFRNVNGAWPQVASFQHPPATGSTVPWLGFGTLNASLAYFSQGAIFRNTGNDVWQRTGTFAEPEVDLGINPGFLYLRGNNLLIPGVERDYELPSHDIDYINEWRTLRVYRPAADGSLSYFARLNPDFDLWRLSISEDGRRVAGISPDNNGGFDPVTRLYVFEIPDSYRFPSLQQDNFQSGNLARWTPSAGQFAVATHGGTRVLRQSSLAGDSGATLTALDWTDQAIEADLRPLEFAGAGRWFGLVTRRTDAQNYYYVTFRQPNVISLRRVRNGVVTQLGSAGAPEPFTPGHSYRVRLESVGDQHAVFLEGIPRVFAKDRELAHGRPGVAGFRTRFDVDNVVVTGGTRLTLHDGLDNFFNSGAIQRGTGTWAPIYVDEEQDSTHFYYRQTATAGDARLFSRVPITNQVVSARMRPLAYGATGSQDPWFGLAARVVDDRNYLYMTLRRSNQLSLRKVVNGAIQVIATVPVTVATNQWYDLRLEVVGNTIRAYVNGDLKFETTDSTLAPSGRSGVLMYRTSADLWQYITYQP